jgi:citrate synthase
MPQSRYLTAREAAKQLGVSLPTLYAYVSRGLIRSEADGNIQKQRRYHGEDVQRLRERKEQRRDPTRATAQALHWGTPLLESSLTFINEGKLHYRGQDAVTLASQNTVEETAALLWTGDIHAQIVAFNEPLTKSAHSKLEKLISQVKPYPLIEAFQMALLMASSEDQIAYDLRPGAVVQTGGRILHLLTAVAAGPVSEGGIAQTLARGWASQQPTKADKLLNAALILMADHELNISSFTARCTASAGATPYMVAMAGLSALQGVKHGGSVSKAETLLNEIRTPNNAGPLLSRRLKHGEDIPGFGHKLYPEGDPRARALLQMMAGIMPRSPALSLSDAVIEKVGALLGEEPNSDFALAVLARLLNLPEGYGLGIFALGRTIGWLAHAIEQYQSNHLIRPRARYVGVMPRTD